MRALTRKQRKLNQGGYNNMSQETFEIKVKREKRERRNSWRSYYADYETVGVTVLSPVPYDLPLDRIIWKDNDSSYSLKDPILKRLAERHIKTVGDLVEYTNYADVAGGFLNNLVNDVPDFGKVGAMYVRATLDAASEDVEEFVDLGWPYSVEVALPNWVREDFLPLLKGNGLDEEEVKSVLREAAKSAFEENLQEHVRDGVGQILSSEIERKRTELQEEQARKREIELFFEKGTVYEV